MDLELIVAFCAAAFLLALMPGPDNIYVLSLSVANGSKQGIGLTLGLVSGVVIHTLLAATGLSIILYNSDVVFTIVKLSGSAYLIYLAYSAIHEKPVLLERVSSSVAPFFRIFRQGFLMNVLNPKVSLFFVALLPQFISNDGWSPMIQMIVLGLLFMIIAFLTFSLIALVAGRLTSLVASPKFWNTTKWIKISVLLILAISLAISSK